MSHAAKGGHTPPGIRPVRLDDKPTVSVVISSRRGAIPLRNCLESLADQCAKHLPEIVVAGAVAEDERRQLTERYPQIRWVPADSDLDDLQLRRLGLAAAKGDIVAFTEDHRRLSSNWLGQLFSDSRSNGHSPADRTVDWAMYFSTDRPS